MAYVLTAALLLTPIEFDVEAREVRDGPCRVPTTTHHYRERLIRCAVNWRSVPGGFAKAHDIGHRESGYKLNPKAYNPSSGACGIFQHLKRYWEGRAKKYLERSWFGVWPPPCTNARANVLVTVRMAHNGGWGPWGG
jgi:hypothetical protein